MLHIQSQMNFLGMGGVTAIYTEKFKIQTPSDTDYSSACNSFTEW